MAYKHPDYIHPYEKTRVIPKWQDFFYGLFPSEEDALYALYEQLFDSSNSICPQTILDAMKYLIISKEMSKQMEEIKYMEPSDVAVLHHREVDKKVEETTKELKKKLYQILEDKIF